jgi:serine/threonine-protein kinase
MAPEQAGGQSKQVGAAADVYALGSILYELLTGRPPFKAATPLDTVLQMLENEPVPPRQLQPKVPRDLETICLKCLQKEPRKRFATAEELAEDLRRFGEGRPVQARRTPPWERAWRWCRRHPAAVVVLLALGVGAVGTAVGLVQAERAEWAVAVQQAGRRQGTLAAIAEACRLQEQARWPQARAVLAQARAQLGDAAAEDLRQPLARAQRDLELVVHLDDIRLHRAVLVEGKWDNAGADRAYEAAFRQAGIMRQDGESPAAVAARVQAAPTRAALVAALDDWPATIGSGRRQAWVLEVARWADRDPLRDHTRDPALWRDPAALTRLAAAVDVRGRSAHFLAVLGRRLQRSGGDAVPMLKAAQAAHPDDFWLNFELALALHYAKQNEEAVGTTGRRWRCGPTAAPRTTTSASPCAAWAGWTRPSPPTTRPLNSSPSTS